MKNGTDANDQMSSLRLAKGSLGLSLYTDCQFKGTWHRFGIMSNGDQYDLSSDMDNTVSSVQVIKAIAWDASAYRGQSVIVMADVPSLRGDIKWLEYKTSFDNLMSSIQVAEGYTVRLYSENNYKGSYIDVKSGQKITDLRKLSFDNKTSSIKILIDNDE